MEAVCEPSPTTACFATSDGLVVTGDFMTQGSFVGCYAAADAAADAILTLLQAETPARLRNDDHAAAQRPFP